MTAFVLLLGGKRINTSPLQQCIGMALVVLPRLSTLLFKVGKLANLLSLYVSWKTVCTFFLVSLTV